MDRKYTPRRKRTKGDKASPDYTSVAILVHLSKNEMKRENSNDRNGTELFGKETRKEVHNNKRHMMRIQISAMLGREFSFDRIPARAPAPRHAASRHPSRPEEKIVPRRRRTSSASACDCAAASLACTAELGRSPVETVCEMKVAGSSSFTDNKEDGVDDEVEEEVRTELHER